MFTVAAVIITASVKKRDSFFNAKEVGTMKRFFTWINGGLLISFVLINFMNAGVSYSEDKYPSKPIKIEVTKSIGGSTDSALRLLQPFMQTDLKVPIVIANVTSGGGRVAALDVFRSQPDGYTLLCAPLPSAIVGQLMYDSEADFLKLTPIFNIAQTFQTVTVAYNSKINSFKDLLELSKTRRLTLAGSGGAGSNASIVYAKLKGLGITNLTMVPFPGASETAVAVMGGHCDLSSQSTDGVLTYVENKQLKVVAVCAPERIKFLPNVPTFKELGYDFIVPLTSSIFGPPKMVPQRVQILNNVFRKALTNEKFESVRQKMNVAVYPLNSNELGKLAKEHYAMIKNTLAFIKEADEQVLQKK